MSKITQFDAERASDAWGANCGPAALAAALDVTLDDVRSLFGLEFEAKGYTNPSLMWAALGRSHRRWRKSPIKHWPSYGLARIQWEGPWTEPGMNPRWAYRHTHWVAVRRTADMAVEVFDVNALSVGGWIPLDTWRTRLVPWLLRRAVPRASGGWHITHSIEIEHQAEAALA